MGAESRRKAIGLVSAGLLTFAVAVVVLQGGRSGEKAHGSAKKFALLSEGSGSESSLMTAYSELQGVHSKWEDAKVRLQQKQKEEEDVEAGMKEAAAKVASLRGELEDRMKTLASLYADAKLQKAQAQEHALARRVDNLQQEVQKLLLLNKEGVEHDVDPVREESLSHLNPRKGVELAAVRTAPDSLIGELVRLDQVQRRLAEENKSICSLCENSEVLRMNRPDVCTGCAQLGGEGDTDISDILNASHNNHAGSAAAAELDDFIQNWGGKTLAQTQGLALSTLHAASIAAGRGVGEGLAGDIFGVGAGAMQKTQAQKKSQALMQVDGSAAEAIPGALEAKDATKMKAWYDFNGDTYLLGTCTPSRSDLIYRTSTAMCRMCRQALGTQVQDLGEKNVRCTMEA